MCIICGEAVEWCSVLTVVVEEPAYFQRKRGDNIYGHYLDIGVNDNDMCILDSVMGTDAPNFSCNHVHLRTLNNVDQFNFSPLRIVAVHITSFLFVAYVKASEVFSANFTCIHISKNKYIYIFASK